MRGTVISVDRDYIEPIDGAHVLSKMDITQPKTIITIEKALNGLKANSVLSDMVNLLFQRFQNSTNLLNFFQAPNCTGNSTLDHDVIIELQRKAFNVAKLFLAESGFFVCKLWFGDTIKDFQAELLKNFEKVKVTKPAASRDDSAEIFLFCSNFNSK